MTLYSFIITVIRYFYPGDNYDVKLPKVPKKIKELLPPHTVLKIIHGTDIELPCLLVKLFYVRNPWNPC